VREPDVDPGHVEQPGQVELEGRVTAGRARGGDQLGAGHAEQERADTVAGMDAKSFAHEPRIPGPARSPGRSGPRGSSDRGTCSRPHDLRRYAAAESIMKPKRPALLILALCASLSGCATSHLMKWSKGEPSAFNQPPETKSIYVRPGATVLAFP